MATRRDRRPVDPLEIMPAELRRENSPLFCACPVCRPDLTPTERDEARAEMDRWTRARTEWCAANDIHPVELMWLERARPLPTKKLRTRP